MTADFDEMLTDPGLDAVVVATPVVTHHDLARRALLAGKHVFVEKPMAVQAAEAEELVALAEERELVLMPGHLLLYHPGVRKLKELVDAGELGDVLYLYGNRQNFGKIRREENALSSLGAHDLSVILHLVGEDPSECWARGESFLGEVEDVVFCYLRFPSGKVAHMHLSWLDPHKKREMTVVGTKRMVVFDDMELERKITIYEKATERPPESYGEWRTRTGDIYCEDLERRAAPPGGAALPRPHCRKQRPARHSAGRCRGRARARAAPELARPDPSVTVASTAVVYPGTVAGTGVVIGDHAVVGKQPALSPRSTTKREPLPPLELGAGTIVSGAVVFAGTRIGANCIVGDQSCVRERCELGDDVVVGRGSLVENDTTIGARTKIQADAYVTAYSTLEDDVFIAPCVVHERQLHGPHGEAPCTTQGADDPARTRGRRRCPASRDRDRGRGVRRRRRGRASRRAAAGAGRREPRPPDPPGAGRGAAGRLAAAEPGRVASGAFLTHRDLDEVPPGRGRPVRDGLHRTGPRRPRRQQPPGGLRSQPPGRASTA